MMDEGWAGFITGLVIGILAVFLLLYMADPASKGYKRAYKDYHEQQIEKVVKKQFPELWIKYNASEEEGK